MKKLIGMRDEFGAIKTRHDIESKEVDIDSMYQAWQANKASLGTSANEVNFQRKLISVQDYMGRNGFVKTSLLDDIKRVPLSGGHYGVIHGDCRVTNASIVNHTVTINVRAGFGQNQLIFVI